MATTVALIKLTHDDVIKWKHFPCYWQFVRWIHRSPMNSPHKGQWREALMFSLICAWINGWVNNGEVGDLRHHRAHYDVIIMETFSALLAICAGNSPAPGELPHKGQWCGALMLSLICVWIHGWVNNREAGDFRRTSCSLWRHRNVTSDYNCIIKSKILLQDSPMSSSRKWWCFMAVFL